jgi:hypothetical protein
MEKGGEQVQKGQKGKGSREEGGEEGKQETS